MRVAFVSLNREDMPDAVIPLGLLYVLANTPERHERVLLDLCFEEDPEAHTEERLASWRPDVVALGMRNIQNNDYSGVGDNLAYYSRVLAAVRRATDAPVVLGGGGFSVMPELLMQHLRPDFGIAGEGERAFPALLDQLELAAGGRPDRAALAAIPNLYWLDGPEVVSTGRPSDFLDLAAVRRPARELLDPRHYAQYLTDSVQTKRGCSLGCDYCTYPTIEGNRSRVREPADVVDEIVETLAAHPVIEHFFVVDSVFNLPTAHAKAVCRELIRRGVGTPWTCYVNPLGFDRELADLMVAAGCAGVEIGSESGCDDVLDALRKGFDTALVRETHEICTAAGLRDCHTFILGTRTETMDHVHRTLDFITDLAPFAAILMVWTDDYEALEPALAVRRRAFKGRILELLRGRQKEFPFWIIPPLGTNFGRRLLAALRRGGLTGPLWQHIDMMYG